MDIILDSLNEEQKLAVCSNSKYLKIEAGPGTGKTSTIAARILNLQSEKGMSRNDLLAISFSKSAKQQLIKKLHLYTEKLGYGHVIEILTFHSLAHRIIRYGIHHGESKFRKGFQTLETLELIQRFPYILEGLCLNSLRRDLVEKAIAQAFNNVRQGMNFEEKFCKNWSDINSNQIFKIDINVTERINVTGRDLITFWKRIDQLERKKNLTDFQGLITESIRLLSKRTNTYDMVTNELRHILVDEYQDSSLAQEDLLFSLLGENTEITVVGDKNQTIYTFNGSSEINLQRFVYRCEKNEPNSIEQIKLKQNYRSSSEIINLSNHFIGSEVINSTRGESKQKPVIINVQNTKLAASYIALEIQKLCLFENYSYKDVCILYRKNSEFSPQAQDVIDELKNNNISYHESLKNNEEIRDIESKVQILSDTYPSMALDEILNILLEEKNEKNIPIIRFIESGIEQGIEDIEDLLDLFFEQTKYSSENSENKVTVQSIHASKGQEYPVVFIVYLGDRTFPHGSRPNIEEEKRLLYVGITRAMEKLYVIGQHGIHQADFLGQCRSTETTYQIYNSIKEEVIGIGFSDNETLTILNTTKQQELLDNEQKMKLENIMADW